MPRNLMQWKPMLGATLLIAAFAVAQQAQRADMMMEAAARKERVDGDLKAAIEQYRKIVAQFAKQPEIAAKALLEMGQCQEKLGQAEARKSYERVLKEYAGAGQYAAQARARLAALSGPRPSPEEMRLRALDSGPKFGTLGGTSSDGRLIAFTDYDRGGSPSVYDTATKRVRRLANLEWDGPNGFGDQVAISRDGKWVAFNWYTMGAKQTELRVVGADGTGMRAVVKERGWTTPLNWTPDGRSVLTVLNEGLCIVSFADGSVRALKKFALAPSYARISPDGRWIAYLSGENEARLIAVDGSTDAPLFPGDPKAQPVDWTPDGKGLVFLSDRSGTRGLWYVAIQEGQLSGEARILRNGMAERISPLGITADGRLLFVENAGLTNSYLLPLVGGAPVRLTPRFEGNNGFAAYSPDGKRLAWFGLKEQFRVGGGPLVVRDLASGAEKTIPAPESAMRNFAPEWLSDNRSIVFRVNDSGKQVMVKLDVETGEQAKLADAREQTWNSQLSPDGRTYYYAKPKDGLIAALDVATGMEKKVAEFPAGKFTRALALSPDGKTLAFVVQYMKYATDPAAFVGTSLELCDLTTGQSRTFRRSAVNDHLVGFYRRALLFTPDSKALVATTGATKPNRIRLIPLDGGADRQLVQSAGMLRDVSISPDGRNITYTESTQKNDLWLLENFLPVDSAQKR